ncbi:peroxiredoxin [Woodsholea maritima]|uniref:peroxiredoxin n=1 Tax=Woodsholea maritima TaxID=240237 RepID=UPI00035D8944|nr:peroxiredoxin [Woodsholea maritima]
MSELALGHKAPNFEMPTDTAGNVSLTDLKGKIVVLYFYPKDDTPGCTKEAIEFSAQKDAFAAEDAIIIGVSKDDVAKHEKFIAKHDLTITLASDAETNIAELYGAWGEKKLYGRTFMGMKRSTFVIDRAGNIAALWRNVRVPGHVDKVLASVKALNAA